MGIQWESLAANISATSDGQALTLKPFWETCKTNRLNLLIYLKPSLLLHRKSIAFTALEASEGLLEKGPWNASCHGARETKQLACAGCQCAKASKECKNLTLDRVTCWCHVWKAVPSCDRLEPLHVAQASGCGKAALGLNMNQ